MILFETMGHILHHFPIKVSFLSDWFAKKSLNFFIQDICLYFMFIYVIPTHEIYLLCALFGINIPSDLSFFDDKFVYRFTVAPFLSPPSEPCIISSNLTFETTFADITQLGPSVVLCCNSRNDLY